MRACLRFRLVVGGEGCGKLFRVVRVEGLHRLILHIEYRIRIALRLRGLEFRGGIPRCRGFWGMRCRKVQNIDGSSLPSGVA